MSEIIKTEHVSSDIRVHFTREIHEGEGDTFSEIIIARVESLRTDLTPSEADYVPALVMESAHQSDYLNALLNGAAGKSTEL